MGRKVRDYEVEDDRNATDRRLSRNMCEKLRRDKLKEQIHLLASKLPAVATYGKKLDKCSILRLAVAYLKMHTGLRKMNLGSDGWCPPFFSQNVLADVLHETIAGFFLVVSQSGSIVCASEKITTLLGHSQFNLLGKSFYDLLHEDDRAMFRAQFQAPSASETDGFSSYCSLYLRMLNLTANNCLQKVFTNVHLVGKMQKFSLLEKSRSPGNLNEKWLVSICRIQGQDSIRELSLCDFTKSEWISQHKMDGVMFYIDSRVSCVTGFLPSEQLGLTPYSFLHEDDLEAVAASHVKIMKEDLVPETIFRLKTANDQFLYIKSSSCVARDPWTKKAKFIVSLNQLLEEQEGKKKLAIQQEESETKKSTNMFTDDIMSVISQALTGNVAPLSDEGICEDMEWGNSQFITPVGSVIRTSQNQAEHENRSISTTPSTNSVSMTASRKRPAEDDSFFNLIKASIISDEEMDVSTSKCLPMSPVNSPSASTSSGSKSCCSSNKHSGSMLKSLLTDEHGKSPFSGTSSGVSSPASCPQSPRTPTMKSSSDQPTSTPSFRVERECSQDKMYWTSFPDSSPRPSKSDQKVVSPSSPATTESSFVITFTEQLKQKHVLMEQSLLLQEATILTLEAEVKKVKSTGHSSAYLQKICDRLNAIKENKAKQQAELQCLQNKLNQQHSSPKASSTVVRSHSSEQLNVDVPSTLANMVFPGSESTSSDLGEIEPTFYPASNSCKTSVSYASPKMNVAEKSNVIMSRGTDVNITQEMDMTHQQGSSSGHQSHLTFPQSFSTISQPYSQLSSFHYGRHPSLLNSKSPSFSNPPHNPASSIDQFSGFPSFSSGYEPKPQSSLWTSSSQLSGACPTGSTQPFYTHQNPLPAPGVSPMTHSSMAARIIDGDRVKTRDERIKIITAAYSKLPKPTYHPTNCTTNVQPKNGLFTM